MRSLPVALLCCVLLTFITGCPDAPGNGSGNSGSETNGGAGKLHKFRVASLVWVGYGPIYIAQEKGYFQEEGIDVEIRLIEDTAARRSALVRGSVDASTEIVDAFTIAAAARIPGKAVLKLDDSLGGDGIVAKKGIASVADLKGKSVAYPKGQPSHFFLVTVLEDAGLTIDDVRSRPMDAPRAGQAFMNGQVDAAVTWEPWLTKASQLPDGQVLISSREKPGLIADIFVVRQEFLDQNPDVVRGFARAWYRAVEYYKANPTEANKIMAASLNIPPAEFSQMVNGVRYSDKEANDEFFRSDETGKSPFSELFNRASQLWVREKLIEQPAKPADVDGSSVVLNDE